jgi:hypothetical protein
MEKSLFEQMKEARAELVKQQIADGTSPTYNSITYGKVAELCLKAVKKNASTLRINEKKRFLPSVIQTLKDNGLTAEEFESISEEGDPIFTLIVEWEL